LLIYLILISKTSYSQYQTDTVRGLNLYRPPQKQAKDTLDFGRKFLEDSIQARQKFISDSIQHRKQLLDSVTSLQSELQPLLDAFLWTTSDDIITFSDRIPIIGDTALGDYVYHKLPLILSEPYTPWRSKISLNGKQTKFVIDKKINKISSIRSAALTCNFNYANQGYIIVIHEDYLLQKNSSGNFFRFPIDSVFLNQKKQMVKIKRYVLFYDLLPGNKKGNLLFTNLSLVKQYQYDANGQMTQLELVKFCDRYKSYDKNEVCSIIKYSVTHQNSSILVTRRNNPENEFSDGTFTFEFDAQGNIKSLSFRLLTNVLKWQRFVDLTKDGNVNCYTDKMQGVIGGTRCMVYHHEPNAKYPVEIIDTSYDKDGIDYIQTNRTTQKSRERNMMTLEWGPWK
jgi:hypothetical protein